MIYAILTIWITWSVHLNRRVLMVRNKARRRHAMSKQNSRFLSRETFKVDVDTLVPYCVLGAPPSSEGDVPFSRFFNLVICHDLFDNYERLKIIVAPLIVRYPGVQVG